MHISTVIEVYLVNGENGASIIIAIDLVVMHRFLIGTFTFDLG